MDTDSNNCRIGRVSNPWSRFPKCQNKGPSETPSPTQPRKQAANLNMQDANGD
jgi:hypothetical protein